MSIDEAKLARILVDLDRIATQVAAVQGLSVDYYRAALLDACNLPPDLLDRLRAIGGDR